jgi:hypothetical protein
MTRQPCNFARAPVDHQHGDAARRRKAEMKKAIKYILATAGMFVLVLFAITVGVLAQNIENGIEVVCDSPQQVEQLITLHSDLPSAVEEINARNNLRVCEILNVAFLVGGIIADASNDESTWQIRKILIVGLYLGRIMSSLHPYEKYAAFLSSKAAPVWGVSPGFERNERDPRLWRSMKHNVVFFPDQGQLDDAGQEHIAARRGDWRIIWVVVS